MDWELIWWCVMGGIAVLFGIAAILPWNPYYTRKKDDPYKYCPKD